MHQEICQLLCLALSSIAICSLPLLPLHARLFCEQLLSSRLESVALMQDAACIDKGINPQSCKQCLGAVPATPIKAILLYQM